VLESILLPSITPFHQPPLYLPVISHVMVGFILSPLDLIRTRLIVQSFMSRHRTYTGPLDALAKIARHEGGIAGMYLHPHLLYPTLLDTALRPLVSLALPGMLTSLLGARINQETNPVLWAFAELGGSCAGLLITLPFETVRRRLQVQVRGSAKPLKACVETRPAPYNGVVDTMWHILTEERSDLPVKRRSHRRGKVKGKGKEKAKGTEHDGESIDETEGWMQSTGLGQLYRGLGMRIGASVIVFLLGVFSGTSGDEGWAEL
jgi:mitochondrial fusion and transport protein UGO1